MKKLKFLKILGVAVGVIIFVAAALLIVNKFNSDFDDLNDTDQAILTELNTFLSSDESDKIWSDYSLGENPIVVINGRLGSAYLINPHEIPGGITSTEIDMPDDYAISVYRLALSTPQAFMIRISPGDFNTIGETYAVHGNDVYFLRYDEVTSLDAEYSSAHFITELSHEAFHYYMQSDWSEGSRFSEELSEADLELLEQEYHVLAQVQTELAKESPDKEMLLTLSEEYVAVMQQRAAANPEYLKMELDMETCEGTAQYVGIKASEIVGYDYGVMYFDNKKDVSFDEVIPMLEAGGIDESFLRDRMPYETGAIVCKLMDALELEGWQEMLNEQTADNPLALYEGLEACI